MISAGSAERRAVHAHLVRARIDGRGGVRFGPNAATDCHGMNSSLAIPRGSSSPMRAALDRRGDVEDDNLVDAFAVVARRERRRITRLAKLLEVDALDDTSRFGHPGTR